MAVNPVVDLLDDVCLVVYAIAYASKHLCAPVGKAVRKKGDLLVVRERVRYKKHPSFLV